MSTVLYLHGFLSSPKSLKAEVTRQWLAANRPDISFVCPQLSSYPEQCHTELMDCATDLAADQLWVIGSSLGGFWADILVEKGAANRAVLVNPAVLPGTYFSQWVGRSLKHYYMEQQVTLKTSDILYLDQCEAPAPASPDKYWVLLQTGDETLDYRLAADKYQHCRVVVEKGGNHSFLGYDAWLPKIIHFFETTLS